MRGAQIKIKIMKEIKKSILTNKKGGGNQNQ